ncbi:hypothetical protein X566_23995 [Afipia sp. P52-10]|uniref:hypothetical protein n=1 Tax=Afipia sp. P52-10 TaxID=1429916 RepID=UPI0003DF12CE|nr:hypothetical protein [Afipia sp. P52-10]ETR75739.1 hypothetical protein X566_23995 [Afipia sp. P52-10]
MARGFRITTINGLLLAAYFIPVWTIAVLRIVTFPIRGIYERANIGPALFINDHLQLSGLGAVRFAWLLALAKFVVVGYFGLFAILTLRVAPKDEEVCRAGGDEPLALALLLGAVISITSMAMAARVGEIAALHLHATEALMLLGGLVLLAVDSHSYGVKGAVPQPPLATPLL